MQIRTREMHQRAEWGVAAHWAYKDGAPANDIDWLNRIIDWQAEVTDPAQFMENLKTDLEQDEVFVFTPKGRVDHAAGRLDHGRLRLRRAHRGRPRLHRRPRSTAGWCRSTTRLTSGDTCEIFTSKVETAGPVAGLAAVRRVAAGPQQDPPVVQPRAARST